MNFIKPLSIKTNRLILKNISLNDQKEMCDILTNKEVSKTYMIPDFKGEEEVIKLFNRFKVLTENEHKFVYGIYLNERLIGFINEVEIINDEIELGYVISPLYKNNGYATEVLIKAIDELFKLGFNVVKTGAFINNLASIRVMEKANMTKLNEITQIEYKGVTYDCVNFEKRK